MSKLKITFVASFKEALPLSTFSESFKEALPVSLFLESFKEGWIVFFAPFTAFWDAVRVAISRPNYGQAYEPASDRIAAE